MKIDVTRNVIVDLWPLYRAGESSDDSRRLVETFLSEDPGFRSDLERSQAMTAMPPVQLSPDAERIMLADARDKVRLKYITIMVVVGGVCFLGMLSVLAMLRFMVLLG